MNKKVIKISFNVFGMIILAYMVIAIVSFVVCISFSNKQREYYLEWQEEHLAKLTNNYLDETAVKINEQDICGFDINSVLLTDKKINELRYLCTHNSYKQGLHKPASFFYKYVIPYAIGKKSDYSNDNITQQLNIGIRGFEFDIYYYQSEVGNRFETYHNSWLETNSSAANFEKALDEIRMWSDYNPSHMPIFITLEPKDDMPLDKAKQTQKEELEVLDALLMDKFSGKIITYSDMLNGYDNFKDLRDNNGYLKVNECIGKVVFLLHEFENFDDYLEIEKTERNMVPLVWASSLLDGKYLDLTCFAQDHNYNKPENLLPLIEQNYIVRTRVDIYPKYEFATTDERLNTGAQLIATDYPPSYEHSYEEHTFILTQEGLTVLLINKDN